MWAGQPAESLLDPAPGNLPYSEEADDETDRESVEPVTPWFAAGLDAVGIWESCNPSCSAAWFLA